MPRCPSCNKWYLTRRGWAMYHNRTVCKACIPVQESIKDLHTQRRREDDESDPGVLLCPSVWDPGLKSVIDDFKPGGGEFGGAGASGSWEPSSPANDSPPQDSPGDGGSSFDSGGGCDSGGGDSGGGGCSGD